MELAGPFLCVVALGCLKLLKLQVLEPEPKLSSTSNQTAESLPASPVFKVRELGLGRVSTSTFTRLHLHKQRVGIVEQYQTSEFGPWVSRRGTPIGSVLGTLKAKAYCALGTTFN